MRYYRMGALVRTLIFIILFSTTAWANDQTPHTCAVVNSSGNIDSIIMADPNAPDNDQSPIDVDDLVIIDGEPYQSGGTLIDGVYTAP